MSHHTYFWYQDQVVVLDRKILSDELKQASMHKYLYCPCVDSFESRKAERYGHWAVNETSKAWPHEWVYRPLESLPLEFRTHLLLLGVS